jgi:hypothetical protein
MAREMGRLRLSFDLFNNAKFMGRSTARSNHHVFGAAEREEGLQRKGAKFPWKVFETKVSGLPTLQRLCPFIQTPTIRGKEPA